MFTQVTNMKEKYIEPKFLVINLDSSVMQVVPTFTDEDENNPRPGGGGFAGFSSGAQRSSNTLFDNSSNVGTSFVGDRPQY